MTSDPTSPAPEPGPASSAQGSEKASQPAAAVNRLFDLRFLIGGLFTFYGILLVIASFFTSTVKSGGVDINLWLGLGMLILGVFFLVWARLRPVLVEQAPPSAAAKAGAAPHD